MGRVLSVEKCLDLLEAVVRAPAGTGVGTRSIGRELGLSPTTVHNLAQTLTRRGYLRQDPTTKRFVPGRRLWLIARNADARGELTALAMPIVLEAVKLTGETAMLTVLDHGRVVRLAQVSSPHALCVREGDDLGEHAYYTATGRMLLASLAEPLLEDHLRQTPPVRHTPRSLTDPASLRRELAAARERGCAEVVDELYEGVSAVAVPVVDPWGQITAALGVSAPTLRFDATRRAVAAAGLRPLAERITAAWGGGAPPTHASPSTDPTKPHRS